VFTHQDTKGEFSLSLFFLGITVQSVVKDTCKISDEQLKYLSEIIPIYLSTRNMALWRSLWLCGGTITCGALAASGHIPDFDTVTG
jgi:hypothetical protein